MFFLFFVRYNGQPKGKELKPCMLTNRNHTKQVRIQRDDYLFL
jgi:hypothetical protein